MEHIVDTLPRQEHLFHIPKEVTYFNCAYMSPQAQPVQEAGLQALQRKAEPWDVFPHHFFDESNEVRELFAQLIGATSGDIALIPSVSYGVGIAAKNIPLTSGQRILVLEDQFPSNYYPWKARAAETGAEVIVIPRPEDGDWTHAVSAQLNEQTAIAALPNCHWTDGSLVDLEAVGASCRELGTALVIDATQSLGALPFDVQKVKPAFLAAAGYKWMLGPYSIGMMYVAPEYQLGDPLEYNWITREGSENLARLVDYTDNLVLDASRYDVGERSNFMLMPMMAAALRMLNEWGVERISATLGQFNRELSAGAARLGFQTAPEHLRAPHLMGLRHPDGLPDSLAAALKERQIFVSVRGDAIRVSPYLYNTEEERDRFLNTLGELL
ncbi:MAG: aminotransferase class V-fold PLP-dependent enzyme [Acidobacteriota bacterium]|nr:aminotransferase class V-fold PLP-dependent enzyme [Acidobacteriota bacterium]